MTMCGIHTLTVFDKGEGHTQRFKFYEEPLYLSRLSAGLLIVSSGGGVNLSECKQGSSTHSLSLSHSIIPVEYIRT